MPEVGVLAVIGGGQMGRGIAQIAAQAGIEVRLLDASAELAAQAHTRLTQDLQRLVSNGRWSAEDAEQTLGRIHPSDGYDALADADFAIEAVVEDLTTKCAVLASADRILRPDAILASNTSSISLTKLAASTSRPQQVIGMHFMNPAPIMKLVEVIRGIQTNDATYERTCALAVRLGKTPITVADSPAFVVNRILIPLLNEACFALQEGVATVADIDSAAQLGLNHPMGPFRLADLIGLDTVLEIAEVLQQETGDDKYRPATVLRNHVAAGWLGRKTGRGFYTYGETA